MKNISILAQRFLSDGYKNIAPKICVIGAGPAGFYVTQHLLKKLKISVVDIIERLPVPFGLVRFGVAPDHPEVKNVINTFTKTAENPNVRFFGNISLGPDISLEELRKNYHVVVLAYGAEENKKLNIPGETLENVIAARKIVGWYNGVPTDSDLKIDLSGKTAAIFGQGNVAIDVARILLTPIDVLKKTDITQHALEQLSESKITKIYLIGRRGPLQAAYTIKELREILKLNNCVTTWRQHDFSKITSEIVQNLTRPKKRIVELMLKSMQEQIDIESAAKIFNPIFLRSPLEVVGHNKVQKVILGINELKGDDPIKKSAVLTDDTEEIECDLCVSSIGYKSIQVDDAIPFNESRGVAVNKDGIVDAGLYTSGWLGTGPVGVILTTMSNAFSVAEKIVHDIEKENLIIEDKPGFEGIKHILDRKGIQIVDWKGWEKINKYEIQEGQKLGKPREKVVNIRKMLEIAS